MNGLNESWFEENKVWKGYKWSIQTKYGIVEITQRELFKRIEFQHIATDGLKIEYAMKLGWRFNVDSDKWYRIKGH